MNTAAPNVDAEMARQRLEQARAVVADLIREHRPGRDILQHYSRSVLALVGELAEPIVDALVGDLGPFALAVMGGGARLELGPHSDVDLVVLARTIDETRERAFEQLARDLVHPLWDAGLRTSIVVYEPSSWLAAASEDLTLCTALLDVRAICGDFEVVEDVRAAAREQLFADDRATFLDRLASERAERHGKYGQTVYLLEPDIKYGPGGLRDVAVLEWAIDASHGTRTLAHLVAQERLGPQIARLLEAAIDDLFRLRAALHLAAKRAQDRLVFQYQEAIVPLLGYADTPSSDAELVEQIERSMQLYYRAAHDIVRYGERLFARCYPAPQAVEPPKRVDERFAVSRQGLQHDNIASFVTSPVLALDALTIARDRECPLSAETFDAIADAAATWEVEALEREPEARARFFNILCQSGDFGQPSALELANELRVLERIVPEFSSIRGRMQHDPYHVYTVDEHTLRAIAMLKRIARGEHNKDYPLATALHLELEDPRVLYLAMLVHDTGKAQDGDQCETGAVIAAQAARRLALTEPEVERCALLVREHLSMPLLSQKRDLTDPLLIAEFADRIGSSLALKELYLLSLADMAQVRPANMTSWKLALLDELYLVARGHMRRGQSHLEGRRQPHSSRSGEPQGMPARYYSLFHLPMRLAHGELIERLRTENRQVLVEVAAALGGFRLTVVAHDRRGLLAHITQVLHAHGLTVLAADVFSTDDPDPVVVDVFRVAPHAGLEQGIDPEQLAHIEQDLEGKPVELAAPAPRRMSPWRRHPDVKTEVAFERDPSGARTIVEIRTSADTDVLRRITLAFAAEHIDIMLARCSNEADRVSSVFYVRRLESDARARLATRLRSYLEFQGAGVTASGGPPT